MELSFGYSPCPNDTYMFTPIANGDVKLKNVSITTELHDVETLNLMAFNEVLDISKLSFYALFKAKKNYKLLLNGGAMGFDCGPIVIAKRSLTKSQIRKSRVVIPGEFTTAHLLFRLWEPEAEQRIFTTYDKIFDFISTNKADCGVIIHEGRFTFNKFGFKCLIDLGNWWGEKTRMPIPLGCIAAKKNIEEKILKDIDKLILTSIQKTRSNKKKFFPYIKNFAQELSDDVLMNHINTFVNRFSFGFDNLGINAIKKLYSMAYEAGIIH